MSIVTVQELGTSAGGKPKVKAGGKWYFLQKNLDSPQPGQRIEIREGSFYSQDGKSSFATIEAWRPTESQPPAGVIDEPTLRFISNCIGNAIAAKTISQPGQIKDWFDAAKAAYEWKEASGNKDGAPFNDNIPF